MQSRCHRMDGLAGRRHGGSAAPSKPCLQRQALRRWRLRTGSPSLLVKPSREESDGCSVAALFGLMDRFASFRDAPLLLPPAMAATIADPTRFPFVDKVVAFDEGKKLVVQSTLSTEDHPFLLDHAIEGVPYHPGVMALEMFAQSSLLMVPEACLAGFEEVAFGLPVKLMKGPMTVRVVANVERRRGDMTWVRCRLVSDLMNSKGEGVRRARAPRGARSFGRKQEDLRPFLQQEVDGLPPGGHAPVGTTDSTGFLHLRPLFPRSAIPIPRGRAAWFGRRWLTGHRRRRVDAPSVARHRPICFGKTR